MEPACLRHTELPQTSKLFADFLYHFDRVAPFYAYNPRDPESFRRAAAAIDLPADRRAALVAALREQNGPSAALDALAEPGTAAVLTGQQVGLFTGPCYTIYKALTAARLARNLTESGLRAVPVFWLATEDHDFEEVNHCWVFNAANQPVRLELAGNNAQRQPVGSILIERAPVDTLREALRDLPFAEETAELTAAAYTPGATMGAAFTGLLSRVLASEPMLFFDPMHPASRQLAAPALARAVTAAPDLNRLLIERASTLAAAGYHVQVLIEPQTSLVFLLENGRRIALRRDGLDYSAGNRRFSAAELAARAADLSPNAVLRPVIQDSMLPTVAYIGGPAEIAYFAQSQVLYRELLGRAPVAVPRQSATLLDARAAKLLARYELALPDFFFGAEAVRERIAARLVPPNLTRSIGETRNRVDAQLDQLRTELAGFDSTLAAAFDTSRRKIAYQLAKTERKTARAALRRDDRATADTAYLSDLLYPHRHLQERFYSMLPFLARHGLGLVERLAAVTRLDCLDHRTLTL
jgi:bacillithiol biosynthesis cysteine-adding enzyme BshC